jgi:hypothetical protein
LLLLPGDNAIRLAARTTRVAVSSLVARYDCNATHRVRMQIASGREIAQAGFARATQTPLVAEAPDAWEEP